MKRKFLKMALSILLVVSMLIAPVSALAISGNTTVQILKVTADGARLRKGPSSAYDVITSLRKGEKVFYLNKMSAAFAYIRTSTGRIGYTYRGYLKSYGAAKYKQIYYCKDKSAKVYSKNRTNSKRVATLTKGQHVIVYAVKGNWAYIKTLDGVGGFIPKSPLAKA